MNVNCDMDTLLAQFVDAAELHGDNNETGDSDAANRGYDKMVRTLQQIDRVAGNRLPLKSLLAHRHPWVRKCAAARLLNHAPDVAVATLTDISKVPGIIGFDAEMTLKEWCKGNLPDL